MIRKKHSRVKHLMLMKEVDNYISHFETYLLTEKRVSKNTFSAYKKDVNQLADFLKLEKKTLKNCTVKDLKNFLQKLKKEGLKAKTLSRKISSIKLFFKFLNERFNLKNRAESLIFPKLEKILPNYLTEQEIVRLLNSADKTNTPKGVRNKVMLYLLYATGMRVSEMVNLRIDQIQFDTGFIKLEGKGNKERMVPLPKNVLKLLKYYVNGPYKELLETAGESKNLKNFIFISKYGQSIKPVTRQLFWLILKKFLILSKISKKVSPHTLRHSLATHLLKNGANIRSIQVLLGHEQLTTVQIYTHLENSQLREVYDKKHPRA